MKGVVASDACGQCIDLEAADVVKTSETSDWPGAVCTAGVLPRQAELRVEDGCTLRAGP